MKILVIEPEKAPYEKEIGDDIHDMQAIVGGCMEYEDEQEESFEMSM